MIFKYFDWICTNIVSTDWRTWNYYLSEDKWINMPLSIVATIHLLLFSVIVCALFDWWLYRNLYRQGYEDGYTDGVISKAVKLGKIKFGDAPNGVVIYETSKEELSNEIETAFKEHQKKDT